LPWRKLRSEAFGQQMSFARKRRVSGMVLVTQSLPQDVAFLDWVPLFQ